ncbi:MAG TPA: copper transporter [Solirubrobacterales bacterium]|nr:copper transporter [Solirubrobacterales bacterium]
MGYSARYHAASLTAVFLALAIGILIGSQVGGDVLNNTRNDLESSLTGDLTEARSRIDDLETEQGWSDDFGAGVLPALTENQLQGDRVGLIGFGSLPSEVTDAVNDAIQPTGAELAAVGVIRQPPDSAALAESLVGTKLSAVDQNPELLGNYGRITGRQLINGGKVLTLTQSELMSQSSGEFRDLDALIVYRGGLDEMDPELAEQTELLDQSLIEGAKSTRAQVVGVEQVSTDPSSVSYFSGENVTSVDNLDQPAGKVSLVYALAGAEGSFGVKEGSDRLLPELLEPLPAKQQRTKSGKQG